MIGVRRTLEEFVSEAQQRHGDRYDYSESKYVNAHSKIAIRCRIHGVFWQEANLHLQGHGCPACSNHVKLTDTVFIERARVIHGDRYDYSEVVFKGVNQKVCIICPEHGRFYQIPYVHLSGGGCRACAGHQPHTNDSFILAARKIHGLQYDYSCVNYSNNRTPVCIICPEHGAFWQTPHTHLRGVGCPDCYGTPQKTTERFIEDAKKVHGDTYDYSKVEYTNNRTKVCIICPKHGEFWQLPKSHLNGKGCGRCKRSTLEKFVSDLLTQKGVLFFEQYGFPWLKWKKPMKVDFYLPDYNMAIECQGHQHFEPIEHFGGERRFMDTVFRDQRKREQCESHGIRIIYFTDIVNPEDNLPDSVKTTAGDLIDAIGL